MKNILKSVRLSQEVFDYINRVEGTGFNQKFENAVLFFMKEEESKKKRVQELDDLISVRSNELNKLNENLNKARSETNRFLYVIRQIEGLKL